MRSSGDGVASAASSGPKYYTSVFFIVMNKEKYAALPPDIRTAIDSISDHAWVAKFGPYWDKWDIPVRDGATDLGTR